MSIKLQAPEGVEDISIAGVKFEMSYGVVSVSVEHAAILASHGFTPYVEPVDAEDSPPAADEPQDQFTTMKRSAVFAWLKAAGVIVSPPIDGAALRKIARETFANAAKAAE